MPARLIFSKGNAEMKGKCKECKYYRDGICFVTLWANGRKVMMGSVPSEGYCDLWDAPENAKGTEA